MMGCSSSFLSDFFSSRASADLDHFEALADQWWDPDGPHRLLHQINPARIAYIRGRILACLDCADDGLMPFAGLSILDIGCGGGLLCEPLARLGAEVVGIDAGQRSIDAARRHAVAQELSITYECITLDALLERDHRYHVVLSMEVVEHLDEPELFLEHCAALVKPGGIFIGSTLNRTIKSYLLAIVVAERVLKWLPPGTHRHDHFMRPHAFARGLRRGGLETVDITGLRFDPLVNDWRLSENIMVNYFIQAFRPA